MKINNKKRNLIRYKYYKTKTDTFYADDNYYYHITYNDSRCKVNQIKQKHGINQRWALMVHTREDGTEVYHKWAKSFKGDKHIFMVRWFDTMALKDFPIAES